MLESSETGSDLLQDGNLSNAASNSQVDRSLDLTILEAKVTRDDREFDEAEHTYVGETTQASKLELFRAFCMVFPGFSMYGSLFALQRKLKESAFESMSLSEYQPAISMLYVGNLTFRMGHNIVFASVRPQLRVLIAVGLGALCMLLLALLVEGHIAPHLGVVYFAYLIGGAALATFEANVLHVLGTHGGRVQKAGLSGIPIGICLVTVLGFFVLQAVGNNPAGVYWAVFVCLLGVAGPLSLFVKERGNQAVRSVSINDFIAGIKEWRKWLPKLKWFLAVMTFNMFAVALFSPGVTLYFYKGSAGTKLLHLTRTSTIKHDDFIAIFNLFFSIGDFSSRNVLYPHQPIFWVFRNAPLVAPVLLLSCTAIGIILVASSLPVLAWLGALCVGFGNGSIYSQSVWFINNRIETFLRLFVLSFWLLCGDLGSFIGSNIVDVALKALDR